MYVVGFDLVIQLSHRGSNPAGMSVAGCPKRPERLFNVLRRLVSRLSVGLHEGECEPVHGL